MNDEIPNSSWCEVCQFEAKGDTFKETMEIWDNHISTKEHQSNVVKYLQYDLGAMTTDEIPEKLDEMFDKMDKEED